MTNSDQPAGQAVPVITIDGPSGSGKGTISQALAEHLGWHHLDSGALYRLLAFAALQQSLDPTDEAALVALAGRLSKCYRLPTREHPVICLDGVDGSLLGRYDFPSDAGEDLVVRGSDDATVGGITYLAAADYGGHVVLLDQNGEVFWESRFPEESPAYPM